MTLRRVRILFLVLVGLVLAYVIYATLPFILPLGNSCPPSEPQRLNDFINDFVLPSSARNLWTDCKSFKGFVVQVRFEVNPGELDLFVSNTKIAPPLASTGKPESMGFLDEAIQAEVSRVDTYLYGRYSGDDWWEELLVDTADPVNYVIYYVVGAG
ncbi:MAG: hypothetical protein K8J31_15135 [Anaerolineae bacterium]|nr:hypothetical protein [Anaerolineae bacterium]